MEKLCIFCIHGGFTDGGGGDYPDPATFDCAKGLLPADNAYQNYEGRSKTTCARDVFGIEDWRKIIVTAQTCKAYEQVKT